MRRKIKYQFCFGIQMIGKKLSLCEQNINNQFMRRKSKVSKIDYSQNQSFHKQQNRMYRTHSNYFYKQQLRKQKSSQSLTTQKNSISKRKQRPLSSSTNYTKLTKQSLQSYKAKYRPYSSKLQKQTLKINQNVSRIQQVSQNKINENSFNEKIQDNCLIKSKKNNNKNDKVLNIIMKEKKENRQNWQLQEDSMNRSKLFQTKDKMIKKMEKSKENALKNNYVVSINKDKLNYNDKKIMQQKNKTQEKLELSQKNSNQKINSKSFIENNYKNNTNTSLNLNKKKDHTNNNEKEHIKNKKQQKTIEIQEKPEKYPKLNQSNNSLIIDTVVNNFFTQTDKNKNSLNPIKTSTSNPDEKNIPAQKISKCEALWDQGQMKYVSVGTCTQTAQVTEQTYRQFLKYKHVQKQKYQKMVEVFEFIQQIVESQPKKFSDRLNKIKKIYESSLTEQKQIAVKQLLEDIFNCQNNFLKDYNQSTNKIQNRINEISHQSLHFYQNVQKNIGNLKLQLDQIFGLTIKQYQFILAKQTSYKALESLQQQILQKYNTKWLQFFKKISNDRIGQIIKTQNYRQSISKQLKQSCERINKFMNKTSQKNNIVRSCIDQIIKLPQISASIYGMGEDEVSKQTNGLLEKIGVFLKGVPQLSKFSMNSSKQKDLQTAGQVFKDLINYKCFACSYLKSKMKFIYQKNKQLLPIMKILKHIV